MDCVRIVVLRDLPAREAVCVISVVRGRTRRPLKDVVVDSASGYVFNVVILLRMMDGEEILKSGKVTAVVVMTRYRDGRV